MAIIRRKNNLRSVSKQARKQSFMNKKCNESVCERKVFVNESADDDMTEDELLDFFLSKDDVLIPKEIWAILDRRAAECIKANNL